MKIILRSFITAYLLMTSVMGVDQYVVTPLVVDDGVAWQATGGFFDEDAVALFPDEPSDAVLNCSMDGDAHSFVYHPFTGNSEWYAGEERYTSFVYETGQWIDTQHNTAWLYSPLLKKWTQTVGGSDVWTFNEVNGCWVYNSGGIGSVAWRWEDATGVWRHMFSDSTWRYNFLTATWDAVVNPSLVSLSIKPPLPLVQDRYRALVYKAFFAARIFAQDNDTDWQVTGPTVGVYSATNNAQNVTATYTLSASTNQLVGQLVPAAALLEDAVRFEYDSYTGSFSWIIGTDRVVPYEALFVSETSTWVDRTTGESWQYDTIEKVWSQNEVTWQYDETSEEWYKNDALQGWQYTPELGTWYYDDGEHEWYWQYVLLSNTWHQVTEHEGLPEGGLPPVVVVHKHYLDSLFNAFKLAGALDAGSGLYGWQPVEQDGDLWQSVNTDQTYQLRVNPAAATVTISDADEYQSYQYDLRTGSWLWANTIDSDDHLISHYDAATGNWYVGATDEPAWSYDAVFGIWTNEDEPITWTKTSLGMWISSESEVSWVYSAVNGTWTELEHGSVWQYEVAGNFWKKLSGNGAGITQESYLPPLPLVQQQYLVSSVHSLSVDGGDFILPARQRYAFALFNEDRPTAYRSIKNGVSIVADLYPESEQPTVEYVRSDDAVVWSFDLATGSWNWSNTYDEINYEAVFNGETRTWSSAGNDAWIVSEYGDLEVVWQSDTDSSVVWRYNKITHRWTDQEHAHVWVYEPSTGVWANTTNHSAFVFNDQLQDWVLVFGSGVNTPPEPVRQYALIQSVIDGVFYSRVAPWLTEQAIVLEYETAGVWTTVESLDVAVSFDAKKNTDHLRMSSAHGDWLSQSVYFALTTNGSFSWINTTDIFNPRRYTYNHFTGVWSNTAYADNNSWEYDRQLFKWQRQGNGDDYWVYDPETLVWSSSLDAQWSYDYEAGVWHDLVFDTLWSYDMTADAWSDDEDSGAVVSFPPHPVIFATVYQALIKKLVGAGVFDSPPVVDWHVADHVWKGQPATGSGIAEYNPRRSLPYYWSDVVGHNQAYYDPTTGAWQWSFDDQLTGAYRWVYDPVRKRWGEEVRSIINGWVYRVIDGQSLWEWESDPTVQWVEQSNGVWVQSITDSEWRYDTPSGLWEYGEQLWGYNFTHQLWYAVGHDALLPESVPPQPVLQQLFLQALATNADLFFDQPLYAGAQTPLSLVRNPLYGSRPLHKNAYYGRYNAGSMLVNAPLTLDGVWLVHNDVSRNLGRLQLPSVDERALPSIIGGERASLSATVSGPIIKLLNSSIACHESLVVAGVRLVVTEREEAAGLGVLEDANNRSALVTYQRGRALDSAWRRGPVIQLGSVANTMVDGSLDASILLNPLGEYTSSSLRDAFIDIYRGQPIVGASEVSPATIQLALRSASEPEVRLSDRANRILFLAHQSRVSVGWPTAYGSTEYFPWTVPLGGPNVEDDTTFDIRNYGNGNLHIDGQSWCISARNSHNYAPPYPVTKADQPGVVYVDYGGLLSIKKNADLVLDTIIATRVTNDDSAGSVAIPSDQLECTEYGRIQSYGAPFSSDNGFINLPNIRSNVAIGRPYHVSTLQLVKGRKRRKK